MGKFYESGILSSPIKLDYELVCMSVVTEMESVGNNDSKTLTHSSRSGAIKLRSSPAPLSGINKVLLEPAMLIHVYVDGCFGATMENGQVGTQDYMTHKVENIYSLVIDRSVPALHRAFQTSMNKLVTRMQTLIQ